MAQNKEVPFYDLIQALQKYADSIDNDIKLHGINPNDNKKFLNINKVQMSDSPKPNNKNNNRRNVQSSSNTRNRQNFRNNKQEYNRINNSKNFPNRFQRRNTSDRYNNSFQSENINYKSDNYKKPYRSDKSNYTVNKQRLSTRQVSTKSNKNHQQPSSSQHKEKHKVNNIKYNNNNNKSTYCIMCGWRNHVAKQGCRQMITDGGKIIDIPPSYEPCKKCFEETKLKLYHPPHLCIRREAYLKLKRERQNSKQ